MGIQSFKTPGDLINDNAGYQDYNNTWSAHKLLQMESGIVDLENDKIDEPAVAGTVGQVLMINNNLDPEWANQTAVALDATLTNPTKGAPADIVGDLQNILEEISEKSKNLLPNSTKQTTVNNVSVTYSYGEITISNTANASGGRTTAITPSFSLPAGTYTLSKYGNGFNKIFLEKVNGNDIIGRTDSSNSVQFTLTAETELYIGLNFTNNTAYNETIKIQIESGLTSTEWQSTKFIADDKKARNSIIELDSRVSAVENSIDFSPDLSTVTLTNNSVINTSTGVVSDQQANRYKVSDYIDINGFGGANAIITSCFGSWFGFCFYDDEKTYISGVDNITAGVTSGDVESISINVPQNAKYIRITLDTTKKANITDYIIKSNKKVTDYILEKVEKGFEDYYSTFSVFEKIGIIGDSFSSGQIYIEGLSTGAHYGLSWGQIMARRCGVNVYNYSASGLSTRSWLTNNSRGLPKLIAYCGNNDDKNLYIIALGLNDGSISDYLGTPEDMKLDYTQNPDTFYGNYARIIENIKLYAPNAKIILSKMPRIITASPYPSFDEAIGNIAEHYSLPLISPADDDFFTSPFYVNGLNSYHPTSILYGGMAEAYGRLFARTAITYRSYFEDYLGND